MTYKAVIIGTLLLAAPLAFAESDRGRPMMPPPGMHMRTEADVRMELDDDRPTTTPDGRPLPPRGERERDRDREHMMGSSTNPGLGWGDRRGENYDEHMMGSSTRERMMGTSTEGRPAVRAFFARVFHFLGKPEATSTIEVDADAEVTHSTDSGQAATTTPKGPAPRAVQEFFQRFFGWFR